MPMIETEQTFKGQKVTYSVESNGYTIYLDGTPWVTQHDPYGKVLIPDGTYEENALAQIAEICNPAEPAPTAEEQLRADVDFLAAYLGVTL